MSTVSREPSIERNGQTSTDLSSRQSWQSAEHLIPSIRFFDIHSASRNPSRDGEDIGTHESCYRAISFNMYEHELFFTNYICLPELMEE